MWAQENVYSELNQVEKWKTSFQVLPKCEHKGHNNLVE
jgi:hypothetical protein